MSGNKAGANFQILSEIKSGVADLSKKFVSQKDYQTEIKGLVKRIDDFELNMNRPGAGKSGNHQNDEEYKSFMNYIRTGVEPKAKKAATVGDAESLGYLAPPTYVETVWERIRHLSTIRDKATVMTIGSGMAQIPVEDKFADAYWEGEVQERQNTPNPTVNMANIPVHKVTSRIELSNILLEDALFDVDTYVTNRIVDAMAFKENVAFTVGDGNLKPKGFTKYANELKLTKSGAVTTAEGGPFVGDFDPFIDTWASLPQGYLPNAEWYMNPRTGGALRKLKDGEDRMLWQEPVMEGQPARLLGYPVNYIDDIPDIKNNEVPIYFGDMRKAYVIVDRTGLEIDRTRDEMMRYDKTVLYSRRRVGGQLILPEALVGIKIGA